MTFDQSQSFSIAIVRIWLFFLVLFIHPVQASDLESLENLSIEQLMNVEVTSVSKKTESLLNSAAAVFVITAQDIRNSGAKSIPETLRMAPGINVAQVSSSQWAVSARGFNDLYANKILVMIDGRSIYNLAFSGVIWDIHDVVLDDIDRIEVIRGSGGTLWGANAVNGVINIITKKASETQGAMLTLSAGTEDKGTLQARYGANFGENSQARISLKAANHDDFEHTISDTANDAWENYLINFRVDSELTKNDQLSLTGGVSKSHADRLNKLSSLNTLTQISILDRSKESAGHFLASWKHTISPTSEFFLQGYFDHFEIESDHWNNHWEIFDLNFQHRFSLAQRHEFIWGAGYRFAQSNNTGSLISSFSNVERNDELFSAFVQDEIQLIENKLWLTIGSKFEHNNYTGLEIQPNIRLLWSPDEQQKIWASVSRAVRTPSSYEHDLESIVKILPPFSTFNPSPLPIVTTFKGSSNYHSEDVLSWEIGYRVIPSENVSFDIATYFNQYHHLQDNHLLAPIFRGTYIEQGIEIDNRYSLNSYGIEVATTWKTTESWKNHFAYHFQGENYAYKRELERPNEHQISIRSEYAITDHLELNLWLRYVDETVTHNTAIEGFRVDVDDYTTLDAHLIWRPNDQLELSVTGQNLLENDHIEYADAGYVMPFTKIPRSVFAQLKIQF